MRTATDPVFDNFHNSKKEAVRRVEQLAREALPADASEQDKKDCEIELIEGDLRDAAALDKVFAEHTGAEKIYAVILIGALKAVGESGEIPIDYYNVNVAGTLNLMSAMDKYDCKRLVYSSSATVYGAPETIPIPESTPMNPHSPYGHTKQVCEMIIRDVCKAHPEWRAITLRYFKYVFSTHTALLARTLRATLARTPAESRATSCPYSRRWPSASTARAVSRCLVTTTPPPTAPVCVTTSTFSTSPRATSTRWSRWTTTRSL